MTRRHLAFACETETLVGTLDGSGGTSGLLIVSGGNEIRAGAFGGMAELAANVAAHGHPVFRFDRRGVGDSTGENLGFRGSGRCLAAALATFLVEMPQLRRVVAFGNCDAASALMIERGAGCHSLVLANPWTIEQDDGGLPPAAIRARYAARLRDPRALWRLVSGGVSLRKLSRGLAQAVRSEPAPTTLAQDMAAGLAAFEGPVRILLAERDRTAQAFLAGWDVSDPRLHRCPGANHAFAEEEAREWLLTQILEALGE